MSSKDTATGRDQRMSEVGVQEWQLLSFFEVEPTLLDSGVPWSFNDALYRVQQGDVSLSFAIAPNYRDVSLILSLGGTQVFEFRGRGVEDVRYEKEGSLETLRIIMHDRSSLRIRVKPKIELSQEYSALRMGHARG
jgi:hypothetical protein